MQTKNLLSIYKAIVTHFVNNLHTDVVDSPYRDYQLWAFSGSANPDYKTWHKILGIPQFAYLTHNLVDGLVSEKQWREIMPYIGVMNTYLMYETVSDNLAIGLYYHHANSFLIAPRHSIIETFNAVATSRIAGNPHPTHELLQPIESQAQLVSAFENSLTQDELAWFAEQYASTVKDHSVEDIAKSVLPPLAANIDTCLEVIAAVENSSVGEIVRNGLQRRYTAVNIQLQNQIGDYDLVDTATDTILVIPVLAYYIGVLAELAHPEADNPWIDTDGFYDSLYDAALLVRLLNDVGPSLLTQESERRHLIDDLLPYVNKLQNSSVTLVQLLEQIVGDRPSLTRLSKDIRYGEFNVVLAQLGNEPVTMDSINHLETVLDDIAQKYNTHRRRLAQNLTMMEGMSNSVIPIELITRFVNFHEAIYAERFDTQAGDYATKPVGV